MDINLRYYKQSVCRLKDLKHHSFCRMTFQAVVFSEKHKCTTLGTTLDHTRGPSTFLYQRDYKKKDSLKVGIYYFSKNKVNLRDDQPCISTTVMVQLQQTEELKSYHFSTAQQ